MNTFAGTVGRSPNIVLYYSDWGLPFQTAFAEQAHAHGAIPLVQMQPLGISIRAIADGHYDAYLRSFAQAVGSYGNKVLVSFTHEMNGNWYSWGLGHTNPGVWKAAWRHVVRLFRQQQADNVIWMWTVSRYGPDVGLLKAWWPGSSYVDWVGIDGYYYRPSDNFGNTFQPTIDAVHSLTGKPILLSEVGVGQVAGQAAKIPGLFAGIKADHLLGVVWFDVTQDDGILHQDWRLEGHPAAIAAFRAGLRSLGLES